METKIIISQPALQRYKWELDTVITSIRGLTDTPIVLLFIDYDHSVIDHFRDRYKNLEIHYWTDGRDDPSYPANSRPWLMWQYLLQDRSREHCRYVQIDSDVIFREWPDLSGMKDASTLYGSDCGGYIDHQYLITRKQGEQIVKSIANIVGISEQLIKDTAGAGAQFVHTGASADMWKEVYEKSNTLWHYLEPLDSDIQKWTAEMWAQLYVFAKYGYTAKIEKELDFCRPTDPIKMWELTKILHNAGVVGEGAHGLVYKGKYIESSPFNEDLSWVRRDKAGWHYARAIDKAAGKL